MDGAAVGPKEDQRCTSEVSRQQSLAYSTKLIASHNRIPGLSP